MFFTLWLAFENSGVHGVDFVAGADHSMKAKGWMLAESGHRAWFFSQVRKV
jgi:hypothetical protein